MGFRVPTELGLRRGPVLGEQLPLEPVELPLDLGQGEGGEPAIGMTETVEGRRQGEEAVVDPLVECVLRVLRAEVVGELAGVAGVVLEPSREGEGQQLRCHRRPGLGVLVLVGVRQHLDVVEADVTGRQRLLDARQLGQEPGQPSNAPGRGLPHPAVVLQPANDTAVALAPVLSPGFEAAHGGQQAGIAQVAGPTDPFDGLPHHHRRQVTPADLGHHRPRVHEILDLDRHVTPDPLRTDVPLTLRRGCDTHQ